MPVFLIHARQFNCSSALLQPLACSYPLQLPLISTSLITIDTIDHKETEKNVAGGRTFEALTAL